MKQIQPFQKHWLQITSIVVCRLNTEHNSDIACLYAAFQSDLGLYLLIWINVNLSAGKQLQPL